MNYDKTVLLRAFKFLLEAAGDFSEKEAKHKAGSWEALPHSPMGNIKEFTFLKELLEDDKRWSGYDQDNTKFLDAGCGIGNVLLLASCVILTTEYHGLELFPDVIRNAVKWLGLDENYCNGNITIFKQNVKTFEHYRDYDIIYYYSPFRDKEKEKLFEEYVEDTMKVGAVLMPHLKQSRRIGKDDRFEKLRKNTFIKIKN